MSAPALDVIDDELRSLVARAQAGDTTAFGDLYDRYVDDVFSFVYRRTTHRQTAEDLTGDVFLRAFKNIGRFEWQGRDLRAWLITIARNRVADHHKSARQRTTSAVAETPEQADRDVDSPERIAEGRHLARNLGRALEALSEANREIIELRFIHDMTTAEAAEVMGRSYDATKQLQFRALKALQKECVKHPGLAEFAAAGLGALMWMLKVTL